ncbi:MAG: PAS domain-containing protein [Chloroflexi bacterium]|nr:PAS domain-containing protein [Chloroflexota bacterium]
MKTSQTQTDLAARLGRVIIFFVLAIAVLAFLVAHVSAWRWATEPFLGMLLDPTLVLSTLQGQDWARLQFDPPLEQPDRLIAIAEQPVERYADVVSVLNEHRVGDTVWVSVTRPNGDLREEQIRLTPFLLKDLFLIFIIPYLVGMVYLGIGIWVYWVQGWGRAGQAFTGLCVALALVLCGIFDISSTHRLPILWGAAVPFAAAAIMHLAMVFPQEPRFVQRTPVLRLFPYLPATYLALRSALSVYDVVHPWAYIPHWRNSYLFAAVGILFMMAMLVYRLVKPPSVLVRQQSRVILLGTTLAFLPVVPWLLINVMGRPAPFVAPLYAPLFAIFPLSIAYAILRYRLMDMDRLLSRGLAYGGLTLLIVTAYFALINGLSHFFAVQANDPILLSLFVLALVLLFNPLRNWFQQVVDRIFFREMADHSATLDDLSQELTQTLDLDAILAEIGRRVEDLLQPIRQWMWLYDEERAGYVGQPIGDSKQSVSPVIMVHEGALTRWLRERPQPLYLPVEQELPAELSDEAVQIRTLGAVVYVPLHARERLNGWLALGPKCSGQPYHHNDLIFLSMLIDQSALSVENARLFAGVRRNLGDLTETKQQLDNVFSSIASGVITTDVQDRVTACNRAAESILGIQAENVIGHFGHHVLRFLGNDIQHLMRLVRRGETPMMAYEIQPEIANRGPVWLRVSISPLKNSHDATSGVAIMVDDLTELRQLETRARRIRGTFERFVSPAVVERLLSDPGSVRLGGGRREVTSFYCDIRGFTAFSENTSPEFQIEVLNKHLTLASGAILAHEGTLDKFVGDGAMAIFNAPVEREDHTMLAVRAALATQQAVREHHTRVDEEERLFFGIGVAVGEAVVGNIGSAILHNFTAIGDCVNFSARLSGIAEPGQIFISAEAYECVQDQIEINFIGHVQVKGHSKPDPVYEVLGLKSDEPEDV